MRTLRLGAAPVALFATVGLTVTAAAPASASISAGPSTSTVSLTNNYNKECLDGADFAYSPAVVVESPCNNIDWYTENWIIERYSGYDVIQLNADPYYCLDGREGTGNVTLQPCGTDGTHEKWFATQVASPALPVWTFENVFNTECLDGVEGYGNVTVKTCTPRDFHQWWDAGPAYTG